MAAVLEDLWKALVAKQERRVADLKTKKCDLRHRLQVLKRTMPAYMSFNLSQMGGKHPDQALKNFVEDLLHPYPSRSSSVNINCTCNPCPIVDGDLVPVRETRDCGCSATADASYPACACDTCEDVDNPICKCAVCMAQCAGLVCDCAMCSPPKPEEEKPICDCPICTAAFLERQRIDTLLPEVKPICTCEECVKAMNKTACDCYEPAVVKPCDCTCGAVPEEPEGSSESEESDDGSQIVCRCTACHRGVSEETSETTTESESDTESACRCEKQK